MRGRGATHLLDLLRPLLQRRLQRLQLLPQVAQLVVKEEPLLLQLSDALPSVGYPALLPGDPASVTYPPTSDNLLHYLTTVVAVEILTYSSKLSLVLPHYAYMFSLRRITDRFLNANEEVSCAF